MSLVDNARAIEAALQRLQGPAASGKLLVKATGADVKLRSGTIAYPQVGGQEKRAAGVFVKHVPTAQKDADDFVTVTSSGVLVDVEAVQGGSQANVEGGASYRWDPAVEGLELLSVSDSSGVSGGDFYGTYAGLRQFSHLKSINFDPRQGLFASGTFDYPAAILAWGGFEPLDGPQAASPGVRTARVAADGRMIYRFSWLLYVVTSRLDGAEARSDEAATLLMDVCAVLADARRIRDRAFIVSMEPGAQVQSARPSVVTPTSYVDVVTLQTQVVLERRPEPRVYSDWLRTRARLQTGEQPPGVELNVPDATFPMLPNGPGGPPV